MKFTKGMPIDSPRGDPADRTRSSGSRQPRLRFSTPPCPGSRFQSGVCTGRPPTPGGHGLRRRPDFSVLLSPFSPSPFTLVSPMRLETVRWLAVASDHLRHRSARASRTGRCRRKAPGGRAGSGAHSLKRCRPPHRHACQQGRLEPTAQLVFPFQVQVRPFVSTSKTSIQNYTNLIKTEKQQWVCVEVVK